MPYFKDEGKDFNPNGSKREQLYLYNAKDCLSTHQIYASQEPELIELGVDKVYNMLIQILPIYKQMEENGILVDDEERKKLLAKYTFLFNMHKLKLQRLAGTTINPLSSTVVEI
jgi:DNA polymerase I-like protein with 3'-5' exonuclease and polymerase domains